MNRIVIMVSVLAAVCAPAPASRLFVGDTFGISEHVFTDLTTGATVAQDYSQNGFVNFSGGAIAMVSDRAGGVHVIRQDGLAHYDWVGSAFAESGFWGFPGGTSVAMAPDGTVFTTQQNGLNSWVYLNGAYHETGFIEFPGARDLAIDPTTGTIHVLHDEGLSAFSYVDGILAAIDGVWQPDLLNGNAVVIDGNGTLFVGRDSGINALVFDGVSYIFGGWWGAANASDLALSSDGTLFATRTSGWDLDSLVYDGANFIQTGYLGGLNGGAFEVFVDSEDHIHIGKADGILEINYDVSQPIEGALAIGDWFGIAGGVTTVADHLSDPLLPFVSPCWVDGGMLHWESVDDMVYAVECRTNLQSGAWTTLTNGIGSTPPENSIPLPFDRSEQIFFRLKAARGDGFILDYRYQPDHWQTAIGLPDDWQKSLIEKSGALPYDFSMSNAGDGFATRISVELSDGNGEWLEQTIEASRVPVVETRWLWGQVEMTTEAFAVTDPSIKPLVELPLPSPKPEFAGSPRADLLLVTLHNTGASSTTVHPRVRVWSTHSMGWNGGTGTLSIRDWRMLNFSLPTTSVADETNTKLIDLEPVVLPGNSSKSFVVSIHSNAEGQNWTEVEARQAWMAARSYWENIDLPYGVVQVPDLAVQSLLNSSIRNIYQAREIKDGLPSFQVGPTVYRGLWIVDGAFLLEAITQLNRPSETRAGVQHMLTFQKVDGSFENLSTYWKENGIVLWTIGRHAQLTGDDVWLESVWQVVEDVMAFIPVLRTRSREDPNALSYDFIPPGFTDGGLGVDHEYSNAYWILIGIKEAVSMANRLGRADQALAWQQEYDELWARFLVLAARDMVTDPFGNRMLPTQMPRPLVEKPQKGQWAFMHAVYPGLLFEPDDSILLGTLANLSDNLYEGLVLGTGWDGEGLWNYAGSFFAHAQLAAGKGTEAARTAYAFANHASPLGAWREEQRPVGHPYPHYVGDMPHNWASAEFIRLVLHLVAFERGDELHLFEGLPLAWLNTGATLHVDHALTRFGEVSLTLQVADDARTATFDVIPPARTPASKLILHGGTWLEKVDGVDVPANSLIELPTDQPSHFTLTLR